MCRMDMGVYVEVGLWLLVLLGSLPPQTHALMPSLVMPTHGCEHVHHFGQHCTAGRMEEVFLCRSLHVSGQKGLR